ncbi:MAG: Oligopeptide ABC transporter, periplasmic oligopeptide-binding protein OppA [uncultured Thermomicrobiales bacterium]|uniref:Oligopeptide ABC transporter, periplasmic oligopeptide-binding protein OppA n=1 Tax=uncultured Thermomicrobiales bacterium TaxID=1645740 RepID=A0A6J4V5N6_9BACT|nr:MAG: Oligopeptide ABC transporter, periplasmic oligopeptide-binding protein OppA [uncultured Thermomicrobiales bacterium]
MGNDLRKGASDKVASMMAAEMDRRQVFLRGAALGAGASAFAATLGQTGYKASAQATIEGMVTVSEQQRQTWIRNFNFLIPGGTFLWPTDNGIYEPSMIASRITGEITPWLAESFEYTADNLSLSLKYRTGVMWSDGTPFTAGDVAFTFNLLKDNAGLSGAGGLRNVLGITSTVEAPDDTTVTFTFTEVYTPGLFDILAQNIVPEHIWSTIEDPVTFLNENPVGTGPFTEIPIFESNYWELRRNPNYWQADKIGIEGLRFPILGDNDTAQRMLIGGEIDWAGNFVPDVENIYVAEDPENHGYWFPSTGDTVHLHLNTEAPNTPFADVNVRKAISQAIDRTEIVNLAMYDYTTPADSTGLSGGYPDWKDPAHAAAPWVTMDIEAANAALDAAGLVLDGDVRTFNGQPMEFELLVVNGWSDWNQAVQIMADNFAEIGIQATVTPLEQTVWQTRVQTGDYTMSIGWSSGGVTPFNFYRGIMSSQTYNPVGTSSPENWARFVSPEADALLDQFAATSDLAEQQRISSELQRVYAEQAPAIPLFPGPQWYEYNSTRFEGWPNEENPYCVPSTYSGERLLLMTTIRTKAATTPTT